MCLVLLFVLLAKRSSPIGLQALIGFMLGTANYMFVAIFETILPRYMIYSKMVFCITLLLLIYEAANALKKPQTQDL